MTKETYLKSVDILLDAYNEGTLFHGNCHACAVGNLIACGMNYKIIDGEWKTDDGAYIFHRWTRVFHTDSTGQYLNLSNSIGNAQKEIQSTGIDLKELAQIEKAFEMSLYESEKGYGFWTLPKNAKQGQYIGLVAVLNVMKDMVEEPVECKQEELKVIAKKFKVEV